MKFSAKEWRRMYDAVQKMGLMLKNSRPYIDEYNVAHEAVSELSCETQRNLTKEIKRLTDKTRKYLNDCGLRPSEPLWKYDIHDQSTWASDQSFKYHNLIKVSAKITFK